MSLLCLLGNTLRLTLVIEYRNHFIFTPLLASTCVGTLEYRCITESIRSVHKQVEYHQAWCTNIDFRQKRLRLESSIDETQTHPYEILFEKLVIACGAKVNTFGVGGVADHAFFLKSIDDARRIRSRILECFELAMQPNTSQDRQKTLMHFVIVGGGPTGVEFAAELHDFIRDNLSRFFPQLIPLVRITLYDIAQRILGGFDQGLAEYTRDRFRREGIDVKTGTRVKAVTKESIITERQGLEEQIGIGLAVWATGLAPGQLCNSLTCEKDVGSRRILTDTWLHLLDSEEKVNSDVYAIGDCAMIKGYPLPCTAQVAKQQAQYLASILNSPKPSPFVYKPIGMMAYVGDWHAIVDTKNRGFSGRMAWLIWRSVYFSMAVSVKNKILIPIYWFLTWIFGRDIANFR